MRYQAALGREKQAMVPFPLTFEEALEKSEARGKSLAMTEAILRLIEGRFGTVPVALRSRLATISELRRLRKIFDRAIEVQTLDQLEASLS